MSEDANTISENVVAESIRRLQRRFHSLAIKKGWYECKACGDEPRELCGQCGGTGTLPPCDESKITRQLLNTISELCEASEFQRKNNEGFALNEIFNAGYRDHEGKWREVIDRKSGSPKPDGFAIELADTFIRLLDLAEYCRIDLAAAVATKHAFNEKREYRHGGKTC